MDRRELLIGSALLALVAACRSGERATDGDGTAAADEIRSRLPRQPGGGSTDLAVRAVNGLGATLYRSVASSQPTVNAVLSPTTIAIALAMTREGAAGVTAAEIDRLLQIVDPASLPPAMNALDQALASRSGTRPDGAGRPIEVVLDVAGSLWGQQGLVWSPTFVDDLAAQYAAGLRVTDFAADPDGARETINAWVRDRTDGRVQQLLSSSAVDDSSRLMLVNAVHLEAPWLTPFDVKATVDSPFTRLDGSAVSVPTMRTSSQLAYAAADGWQAVDLPYSGYGLTMTVLLPGAGRLAEVEAQVSPDLITTIVAGQALRPVELGLPRWDTESSFTFDEALAAAGMPSAFDPATADFSAMTATVDGTAEDGSPLALAGVHHQANLSVNEAGTEAAAATAVAAATSAAPTGGPVTMLVDRPFLYFVRDVATGAVVFLGRVADPSSAA